MGSRSKRVSFLRKNSFKKRASLAIRRLFDMIDIFSEQKERFLFLIKRISQKSNVRLESDIKIRICKYCGSYLRPGVNCRVRLRSNRKLIVYYCLECKNYNRFGYGKKN